MEKASSILFYFMVFYTSCEGLGQKQFLTKNLEQCPVDNAVHVDIQLSKNSNDELALNIKASYEYDIDENYKVSWTSYIYKNDEWIKHIELQDKWCSFLEMFAQPWNVIKNTVKPSLAVAPPCTIPAGSYNLENFQISYEDSILYFEDMDAGKYKSKIRLFNEEDGKEEDILCLTSEFEIVE